jgi:hypothetical protein
MRTHVDAFRQECGRHGGSYGGVGVGAGGGGPKLYATLGCEPLEIGGGDHALGSVMWTEKKDYAVVFHGMFLSGVMVVSDGCGEEKTAPGHRFFPSEKKM